MIMRAVGIRELKNKLSEYLRIVRAGETVFVTDRGKVVAELVPPGEGGRASHLSPGLAELVREGRATPGGPRDPSVYRSLPRLCADGTAQRLLDEDRGER